MRESNGQLLVVAKKPDIDSERAKELLRKRQNLQKKPRYGTVNSHVFVPGAGGLNDKEPAKYSVADAVPPGELALMATIAAQANASPKKSSTQDEMWAL